MRYLKGGSMLNNMSIKPHNIVFAHTTPIDYEMSRYILLEDLEGFKYGEYLVLEGGHCSCFGFDETEWSATVYNREELLKLANAPYYKDHEFFKMVRNYFSL